MAAEATAVPLPAAIPEEERHNPSAWVNHIFNTDEDTETFWAEFAVKKKKNEQNLTLVGCGDGLDSLLEQLSDDRFSFIILKVLGKDLQRSVESVRLKKCLIEWKGENVSGMATRYFIPAKNEFMKNDYAPDYSVETGDKSMLSMEGLAKSLLSAGGAHPCQTYECGTNQYSVEA